MASAGARTSTGVQGLKCVDIGANLTDPVFRGWRRGKQAHPSDFQNILQRAFDVGVEKVFISGGTLPDSRKALELAKTHDKLYCTIGVHPTRCNEFDESDDPERYLDDLLTLIKEGGDKVVAVGEIGLDFDRLHFCPKDVQLKYFEQQFQLAEKTQLPLFLHSRDAHESFIGLMRKYHGCYPGGVVHSFTGKAQEAADIIDLGLSIGINGCSLKTQENLDVMKTIPKEKLMIETDSPWCEVRPTHDGYKHVKTFFPTTSRDRFELGSCVKGRTEPCHVVQVLEIMAAERGEELHELASAMYENTMKTFFPKS